ncbi:MAG: threonylcarbamoyl-AMP synthase [Thermoplasmata archaeon]|nr:threonylcarbamoyl-AMP synthase [Thermoplasmata archaeon]
MDARIAEAVRALRRGAVIVYPTDTLLGLGARAVDRRAVERLCRTKRRPGGMPISLAVSSIEELESLIELDPLGRRFVREHLPGPYTLLARATPWATGKLAPELIGHSRVIGVRVPDHRVARELAREVGPIVSTSANRHGEPPCRTVEEARRVFGSEVGAYLAARPLPSGRPSMIVDLRGAEPRKVARG